MSEQSSLFPAISTRRTISFCWRQLGPHRRGVGLGWALTAIGSLANAIAAPLIFATILQRIASLPRSASLWSTFGTLLLWYAGLLALSTAIWRLAGWIAWGASLAAFADAIRDGYRHLVSMSHRWHTDRPAGEVISTLETFSWAYVDLLETMTWGVVRVVVTVASALVVLAIVAWPVALVMTALVAVFALVLKRRTKAVIHAAQRFSDTHSRATGVIADTIANLTTIRAQAMEPEERERIGDLVGESVAADLNARRIFAATRLQMESALAACSWGALVVGVVLALRHELAAGVVYLVLFYGSQVVVALEESFEHIREIARNLGRCAKFAGVMETAPEIVDVPGAGDLVVERGAVHFDRISFGHSAATPLFRELTLDVAPGEHVGLVGASGSGKTTLTRLLLRFMDLDGGQILIDGQDIATATQRSLRRKVSYVPQDPQMLHRTIAENIAYGLGVLDPAVIERVGRAAHVEEFVARLPDGYDTVVGERGLKLSGGQRQRVAIAQAMAKAAPILVLDEATSALDSESESLVQDALWRLMEDSTAIVVAHRLSTIARLDRIIVLDGGQIVEAGSHAELLTRAEGGVYARLWKRQSGGFLAA